jgi:hypothetical protein
MKTFFTLVTLLSTTLFFAQAYSGKGDVKFGVGVNIQSDGTGISGTLDYGLGENISIGIQSIYLLGVEDYESESFGLVENPQFEDRFDIRARFNANLGNVINISEAFDVYPGLSLGLKNFGAHLGSRYFFTNGFGVFGEIQFPIAKYNNEDFSPAIAPRKELNNQFNFTIGASFNI